MSSSKSNDNILVGVCPRCSGAGEIDLGACGDPECCSPNPECEECHGAGKTH